MKSDIIKLSSEKLQLEEVYSEVEKCASYAELSKKDTLHLRLLTEELIGMIREVLGDYEASIWIQNEKKDFEIHLEAKAKVGSKRKEQLLSVAKNGKNMVTKSMMGKVRRVMEICFFADGDEYSAYMNAYAPFMQGMDTSTMSEISMWSMSDYLDYASTKEDNWDELEKSIVVKLADDVCVGVQNRKAEIIIKKNFE